ncbi:unnamed protein product [Peniophora sp. CBMAI 1063]|nr:unnamed protein product [Peniophora sp. CBMAI 1063]
MPDLVEHKLIETIQLDVCNEESIAKAQAEIEDLTDGKLDFLINNAGGAAEISPAVEIDLERAKQQLDLNFWGAVRMVKAFTPLLMRGNEGHIVNVSSAGGTLPIPYLSMYGSAKAALNHYGDVLRVELAPFNISVTTVVTGSITNSRNRDAEDFVLNLKPGSLYSSGLQAHRKAVEKESESPSSARTNDRR